jgi:hypothetical protein
MAARSGLPAEQPLGELMDSVLQDKLKERDSYLAEAPTTRLRVDPAQSLRQEGHLRDNS